LSTLHHGAVVARFQRLVAEGRNDDAFEQRMHHAAAATVGQGNDIWVGDGDGAA
jgi:hypothetical protein